MLFDKESAYMAIRSLNEFTNAVLKNTNDFVAITSDTHESNAITYLLYQLSDAVNGPQIDKDSDGSDLAFGLLCGFQAGLAFANQCTDNRHKAVRLMMESADREGHEASMRRLESTLDDIQGLANSIDNLVTVYTTARMVCLTLTRDDELSRFIRRTRPEIFELPTALATSVGNLEAQLIRSLTSRQEAQATKVISDLVSAETASTELLDKLRSRNS